MSRRRRHLYPGQHRHSLTLYITRPPLHSSANIHPDTAILLLSDSSGLDSPANLLLADSFARAGYLTVVPDLFSGSPSPIDLTTPGFNLTLFLSEHPPSVTDPIIASTISFLRSSLNVTRIGAAGYCFGGRYAFRFLDDSLPPNERVDVAFVATPTLLQDDEVLEIDGPVSVAAADNDGMVSAARRAEIEALLLETEQEYMVSLYSGTLHGFASSADVSGREQRFAKESAFLQAVRWFDEFLGRGWSGCW
ncbi:alpha/beta-hydrolase [Neurospora crassa]|uniref:Dienelactone hydrolase n=1 Tax=Neurospora crassa (strain ATCC 24698 / 74-OR23-1A / CBS 708.71 / DSM 1257 / FGSC 987) TaxID=367110 RepID=Q7S3M2_NEUCR|nr:dienelactone hydrolase [Neurospora crassa OR74A]EAA30075.2 dienelactone hydrolase [Neurospora crassa OR74A]KHE86469.1 alpha/beta-hydrolase [Neurospora crassa]|eukprot:XP_959311.2 dienelactone hydrolase [Neurospora crassa OR74A]